MKVYLSNYTILIILTQLLHLLKIQIPFIQFYLAALYPLVNKEELNTYL